MAVPKAEDDEPQFWEGKRLDQLTPEQWESLCDGCGRCCLIKLEDWDSGERFLTRLSCKLLDNGSCRCSDYANRHKRVPDCVAISHESLAEMDWLPQTCAYVRVAQGKGLAWWHPLVSGDPTTVHAAGISIRGWALSESKVDEAAYNRYIIRDFPGGKSRKPPP